MCVSACFPSNLFVRLSLKLTLPNFPHHTHSICDLHPLPPSLFRYLSFDTAKQLSIRVHERMCTRVSIDGLWSVAVVLNVSIVHLVLICWLLLHSTRGTFSTRRHLPCCLSSQSICLCVSVTVVYVCIHVSMYTCTTYTYQKPN